ncbi:MAG TPA: hypothetical protein VKB92_09415 [Myxococcales bacterium]|nr:hypothetical protein [Myxococcales bacterium]
MLPFRAAAIAAFLAVASAACSRGKAPAQTKSPSGPADEKPEYNFRFRPPGPAWTRQDPDRIDPIAKLAYARSRPDLSFLVYVSRPGGEVAVDAAVASWKRQLEAQASGPVDLSSGPLVLHGLSGTRAVAAATVLGTKVVYENWIVARNGWLYQLLAWGMAQDRKALHDEASAVYAGFEVIDPAARIAPVRRPVKQYASKDLGWSIDLGMPWMEWGAVQESVPAAEYGARCGDGSLVVVAVPLLGHRPPLDVAVPALLSLLDVRNGEDLPRRPVRVGSWSGFELPSQRKVDGRFMRYLFWTLEGEEAALVAAEWRPLEQPENECAEPLEKLATGPGQRLRPDEVQRKDVAARFFVEVAQRLRASGRAAESAAYFAEAGALAPGEPGHLLDEVRLLKQAGRRDEAFRRIAARLHGAPCASPLRAEAAQLLADLGRSAEAIATWTSAFGCGYRDPDALSQYLRFLERHGRLTFAFHEAQAFADPTDLPRIRGQLAAGESQ